METNNNDLKKELNSLSKDQLIELYLKLKRMSLIIIEKYNKLQAEALERTSLEELIEELPD